MPANNDESVDEVMDADAEHFSSRGEAEKLCDRFEVS